MSGWPTATGTFGFGDLPLQSGAVLPGAHLRWKAHGTLAPGRDNVVLYPTSYGAQHPDVEGLIGPEGCSIRAAGSSSSPTCSATACRRARRTRRTGLASSHLHRVALGAPDLDTFLRTDWEERFARRPAADLYAQFCTSEAGDISRDPRYGGDLTRALNAITARLLLMPGETDLYFRVADNAAELPHLRDAVLRPIPSIWGHRAGNPAANAADAALLRDTVRAFLKADVITP